MKTRPKRPKPAGCLDHPDKIAEKLYTALIQNQRTIDTIRRAIYQAAARLRTDNLLLNSIYPTLKTITGLYNFLSRN